MKRNWMFTATLVAVALVGACGKGGTSASPSVTASPTPSASPSPSPTPSSSPTGRFSSIDEALAFIKTKVSVPVLLPDPLPSGTRLTEHHPVEVAKYPGGPISVALNLVFGTRGELRIEYGAPTFGDCEGDYDTVTETRVGDYSAVLGASENHSTILWPATFRKIQGKYKLSGTFSGDEILQLAESMRPVPGLEPETPPPAC